MQNKNPLTSSPAAVPSPDPIIQVQWTCISLEEAKAVAEGLLAKRLAACVTIFPNTESLYVWKGCVETATETTIFIKTLKSLFALVRDYILQNCSYETPQILYFEVDGASEGYEKWVRQSLEEETSKRVCGPPSH